MRQLLILCLAASGLTLANDARAAPSGGGGPPAAPVANYIDIATVALPIVYERRLINYVFVGVRLNLVNGANAIALGAKEPYFRDALVKAAHRRPFTRLDDFTSIDEAALKTVMAAEATRIAGPRAIASVQITNQAPKSRVGLPRPPKAPAPGARPPAPAAKAAAPAHH